MRRRITISRDGAVKADGKPTRWRVSKTVRLAKLIGPHGQSEVQLGHNLGQWRAYLASLTDEELRG